MPPLAFVSIPITTVFLLAYLGLLLYEIEGLAGLLNPPHSTYWGNPNAKEWGPNFGPNFENYTYYLPVSYTATTPPIWPDPRPSSAFIDTHRVLISTLPSQQLPSSTYAFSYLTTSSNQPYQPLYTGLSSSLGSGFGNGGSGSLGEGSNSLGGVPIQYSTYSDPYENQLSSILNQFSTIKKRTQPTNGIEQIKRVLPISPTIAPLFVRHPILPTPTPMIKRQTIKTKRSQSGGIIQHFDQKFYDESKVGFAFFIVQAVCMLVLLGLFIAFWMKHRKFHKGGYHYETTTFFHSFFKAILIVSIVHFISGIICFAVFGSSGPLGALLTAEVVMWAVTIVCLIGLLFTLKVDARRSIKEEGRVVHYDGGETGKGESTPNQEQQQQQQSHDQQQVVSMPEPHSPQ